MRNEDVGGDKLPVAHRIGEAEIKALQAHYAVSDEIDVVVFSAPQLSLYELRELAALCDGRNFKRPLLAITSPQVKPDADRMASPKKSNWLVAMRCRACAFTSLMPGKWQMPTAGSASPPTAQSW